MIDIEKKILFIQIPKCGSTSVQTFIYNNSSKRHPDGFANPAVKAYFYPIGPHATYDEYRAAIGPQIETFKKFTVVRPGEEILISAYFYGRSKNKHTLRRRIIYRSVPTFIGGFFLSRILLPFFPKRTYIRWLAPIRFYTSDSVKVFQLNEISKDPSELCSYLEIPRQNFPRENVSPVDKWLSNYHSHLISIAAKLAYALLVPIVS